MTPLPHTHTNDPLSIPVCNGCISVIMSNLGNKSKKANLKRDPNYYKNLRAKGVAKQRAKKLLLDNGR